MKNTRATIEKIHQKPLKVIKRSKLFNYITIPVNRLKLLIGREPVRTFYSMNRGLRLHRYYLEHFLQQFAADIRGHCLEFQEDSYTTRFGNSAVQALDVLHKDDTNPKATIVADLTQENSIKSNLFDCIICTHVLQHISEPHRAISELHRILKPGGILLMAEPHINVNRPRFEELWRFTPLSVYSLLEPVFGSKNAHIYPYGNSLTAAGCLRGLMAHEFTRAELNHRDPRYALEVCARAEKTTIS